jgi:tRNA-dihydrouridine synthase C
LSPLQIDSLALAPMEGVTDVVTREIFAALGSVDYVVTEFVRVTHQPLTRKQLLRATPELAKGARVAGVPVHVQLLGGDAARVAESARTAHSLGATWIDLNFGCPAPTVNRHDGGATLLKDPKRVYAVTRAVREALPKCVSVSAKVRLGWDNPDSIIEIACAVEEAAADMLTIHGRTRTQGYAPPADWGRIGRARERLRIPVVANGDLVSRESIEQCQRESGCTRFMLGRGALAMPELFRRLRNEDEPEWSAARRLELVDQYITLCLERGAGRERLALARAKQWLRMIASKSEGAAWVFERCKHDHELGAFRARLHEGIAWLCDHDRSHE